MEDFENLENIVTPEMLLAYANRVDICLPEKTETYDGVYQNLKYTITSCKDWCYGNMSKFTYAKSKLIEYSINHCTGRAFKKDRTEYKEVLECVKQLKNTAFDWYVSIGKQLKKYTDNRITRNSVEKQEFKKGDRVFVIVLKENFDYEIKEGRIQSLCFDNIQVSGVDTIKKFVFSLYPTPLQALECYSSLLKVERGETIRKIIDNPKFVGELDLINSKLDNAQRDIISIVSCGRTA